jgi:putative nucleotidyltransferase with HDIG domain
MDDRTTMGEDSRNNNGRTRSRSRARIGVAQTGHVSTTPDSMALGDSATRPYYVPPALFAAAAIGVLWAVSVAPRATWGLAGLLAAATLLDLLAGDLLRAGRRVVAPGLVVGVAAFVLYGTPAAVIVGCARGIVRALSPKPASQTDASCILATSVLGPLLGGLCASAVHLVAPQAWIAPVVYIASSYVIEAGAAMLLLSRFSRPSLRLSFEQTFGWTMLHYGILGALGAWLGADLLAGRWIALAYFAVPMAVIRQGFDVFQARSEQYVASLERENTHLFDKIGQLDRITGDLAEAVGMAIDCRTSLDQDHSHRVARLATAIGTELGMAGADLEVLRRGALLHDVGTLAIPSEIFEKPGSLTPAERRRMQLHSEFGARLVAKWRDCPTLAAIIVQHHERLDGSGYPRGLRGNQIAMEARIVGAAEAYVALTSDRPHRPQFTHEEAMAMLRERTPSEYDPTVMDALVAVASVRTASVLPLPIRTNG